MSHRVLRSSLIFLPLLSACVAGRDTTLKKVRESFAERAAIDVPWNAGADQLRADALADATLTVDEATRLALVLNPRLAAILEGLGIARADLVDAVIPANPVLDAELRFMEGGSGELLEFTVVQNVLDLLFMPRRKQVAEARLDAAVHEATGGLVDLVASVRRAYRALQANQELAELYRTALDTSFYSYDLSRRLYEAGNVIELDVLNDQVLYEELKLSLVRARTAVAQGRENVNLLLGLDGEASGAWTTEPRLPGAELFPESAAHIERAAVVASLDLAAQRAELEALGHEVGLRRLEDIFGAGSVGALGEREADQNWLVGPVAAVSLPLWNFGQAASARGKARFRMQLQMFTDTARRIRRESRSLLLAANVSGDNSNYLREVVVPLRSRLTQATQLQFNAMQIGAVQLLDAKRREIAVARDYVESLRTHWMARIELEALLMGRRTHGGYALETLSIAAGGGAMGQAGGGQ